jgi:hypothetical protein
MAETMRYAVPAAMRQSLQPPIAPGKVMGAWVCLIAALLLWSPMWAAAWQANRMECCDGAQCPIHGHQFNKHKSVMPSGETQGESSMECHHTGASELMQCSVSCCHDHQQVFSASVVFVLTLPANIQSQMRSLPGPGISDRSAKISSFEPLSPPPKRLS